MSVHIGNIISAHLKENGITRKFLAEKINRSRDYMYKVLKRPYISTEDLYAISEALEHNFFWYYTEALQAYPPSTKLNQKEDIESLRSEHAQLKKENEYLVEINRLLKEKIGEE